jgi:hypothetical protein
VEWDELVPRQFSALRRFTEKPIVWITTSSYPCTEVLLTDVTVTGCVRALIPTCTTWNELLSYTK